MLRSRSRWTASHEVVTLDVVSTISRRANFPIAPTDSAVSSPGEPAPSLGTTWLRLAEKLIKIEEVLYLPVLVAVLPAHGLPLHIGRRRVAARDTTCPPVSSVMLWENDWLGKQPGRKLLGDNGVALFHRQAEVIGGRRERRRQRC